MNKTVVENAVAKKLRDDAFNAIISQTFIRALPVNESELNRSLVVDLCAYTGTLLESLGGYDALILSKATNRQNYRGETNTVVDQIHKLCTSMATRAAARIVSGYNLKDGSVTLESIVCEAEYSKDEQEDLNEEAEDLDIEAISDTIKEKTINTIKEEKAAYEKDRELDDEVEEILGTEDPDPEEGDLGDDDANNDDLGDEADENTEDVAPAEDEEVDGDVDSADVSGVDDDEEDSTDEEMGGEVVESFLKAVLGNSVYPRRHVSIFSRLQETCLEALLCSKEEYCTVPMKTINAVTFNSTFESLEIEKELSLIDALENINVFDVDMVVTNEAMENKIDDATASAIVIYTALETLRTLKLYSPTMREITKFVNQKPNFKKAIVNGKKRALESASNTIASFNKTINSSKDTLVLEFLRDVLDTAQACAGIPEDISNSISRAMESACAKIEALSNVTTKPLTESDIAFKNHTVAGFNKINRMYSSKPAIEEIRFMINKSNPDHSSVDVHCRDAGGNVVSKSFVPVMYKENYGDFIEFVQEAYSKSSLVDSKKKVSIYFTDENRPVYLNDTVGG